MKTFLLSTVVAIGAASAAHAAPIVSWDLNPFSYGATISDANIDSATDITLVGLNPVGDGFDGIGIEVEGAQNSFTDYITTTITAAPGFAIDLNGGSLTAVVDFINGSGTTGWRADAIFDSSTTVVLDSSVDREDDINAAIAGVPVAQEIELRVYFANASWGDYQIGDIVLSGAVVPEPASLALLGLGGLLVLRRR